MWLPEEPDSGLLKYPEKIGEIISCLVDRFRIPVTAKIRLGWDRNSMNFIEIAKILEANGAKLITVHGRTRDQRWRESAIWQPIRDVKSAVSIPVIGNGDVKSIYDINNMYDQTGCDGIMIGRAAIGNPWIFSRISKNSLSQNDILDMISNHWKKVDNFYGRERALVLFRKHLKAYLSSNQFISLDLRQ